MNTDPFEPITRERAAEILGISLGTLDVMVRNGDLPPPCRIGNARKLYWHPDVFYQCVSRHLLQGASPNQPSCGKHDEAKTHASTASPCTRAKSASGSISECAKQRQKARLAALNH